MNSPKKAKQYCIISQTKGYNFGIKETRKLCKVDNFILIYNIKRIHTKVIKNDRSYDQLVLLKVRVGRGSLVTRYSGIKVRLTEKCWQAVSREGGGGLRDNGKFVVNWDES